MPRFKSKSKQSRTENLAKDRKEKAAKARQTVKDRQEFIGVFITSIVASVVLGILTFAPFGSKVATVVFVITFITILSYKYQRKALWLFLIYLPFGGTVTYAVASGNVLFQLAKDSFYIPSLLALVQKCQKKRLPIVLPKQLKPTLVILLTIALLTLLLINGYQEFFDRQENDHPIAVGLVGLKVLMGYIPLITCAYYLIRTKKELLFLTRMHLILAIICCGLAFVQYYFLVTGRCEGTRNLAGDLLYKANIHARCFVGGSLLYSPEQGVIRLPGTLVAPWQWGWFLIANAFFTYATAFNDPSRFWRLGGLIGMATVFVSALISGQRIAMALVPIVTIILLILTGQIADLKRFIPIAVGLSLILGIGLLMYPDLVQERITSFIGRWNASPPSEFIAEQTEFTSKQQNGLFGHGLGRATNSARSLGQGALIETFYPKLFYEIGPLGVVAFLALVTALTVITFKAYRSVKDRELRSFGASFWVFVLIISYNTYYYPLDVDPVAVYYWFFAGVILKLPEIERQENPSNIPQQKSKKKGRIHMRVPQS